MAITMEYLRAIQGTNYANTRKEAAVREIKRNLTRELQTSIHYETETLRNGVPQNLVVTSAKANDECDVFAMPDETILVGDIIDCYSQKWIIVEVIPVNTLQLRGKMKLCNHLFKFQDFSGIVFERWGVLDPGVYSTTQKSSNKLVVEDSQYKVYLPSDEYTNKLFVDKRFSTGVCYDKNGDKILRVYRITRIDDVSESWGEGKLIVAYVRSDVFNPTEDDIETGICNYVPLHEGNTKEEDNWY